MALNSDFKVKDSLYVGNSAYFTGCTNTDGEILSAGQPLASLFIQQGEVAANCNLTDGTGIADFTYNGAADVSIAIDSTCNSTWNAKTTCTGTITCVSTTGDYLTGGGSAGAVNIGINSACAEAWNNASAGSVTSVTATGPLSSTGGTAPGISLDATCTSTWNTASTNASNALTCAGLDCIGTTTASNVQTFTNKCGSNNQWVNDAGYTTCTGTLVPADIRGNTECTGTTTPSSAETFTNKSGSNNQWTNDAGYTTCTGDIEGVTTSSLLSGGGTSGCVTIGIDCGALDYLNQSGCAGITCVGTVTSVGGTGGIGSTGGTTPSLSIDAACNTKWDQSSCAGLTKVGTVTCVSTTGLYLTGGGTTSLNVGLDSACGSKWDASAAGGVTSVTGGDGVDVTGGLTPTVCVDSTVARTDDNETFSCNVTVQGNLTVDGTTTTLNTNVETTSAFSISNHGTGPALDVEQTGTNDLATFTDSEGGTICFLDGAKVKITPSSAANAFCVGGDGRITGDTILNGGLSLCGVSSGTDDTVLIHNADGSVSTREIDAAVWGADLIDGAGTCDTLPKYTNGTGTIGDSSITDNGTVVTIGADLTLGNAATIKQPSTSGSVYTEDKVFVGVVGTGGTTIATFPKTDLNSVKYEVTLVKGVNITAFEIHAVYNGTGPCGTTYAIVDAQATSQLDDVVISSTGTTIDLTITSTAAATTATIYGKAKY